jgi:hypothetical protein
MSSAVELLKRAHAQYSLERLAPGQGSRQRDSSCKSSEYSSEDEGDDSTSELEAVRSLKAKQAPVTGSVQKGSPNNPDISTAFPTTTKLNTADSLSEVILRLVNVCHLASLARETAGP